MTTEDAVMKATEGHYKMTGRAISKKELKEDAERILGMGISHADFERALEALKREKCISDTKPGYYVPYGVKVNDGPFPKSEDIVPTPRREKVSSACKA